MNIKKILVGSAAGALMLGVTIFPAFADSIPAIDFESYTLGTINGQDGWSSLGAAGSGCAVYDHAVSSSLGTTGFASQSLRISNAVVSGCFGDQTFSKSLTDEVGETSATNASLSGGVRQKHFEMQFDLASTVPGAQQPNLYMSVSPDRGDGSRMSYLRFEDNAGGIDVFFDDVQGTTNPASFVETQIGPSLDRSVPHNVKLTLDTLDGPSNDVVKVWIDGNLMHTGTSWENYFRFDSEALPEAGPRTLDSVLFRTGGSTNNPSVLGKGFLVDNLSTLSGPVLTGPPTSFGDCNGNGWQTFNNPSFTNRGRCIAYVAQHLGRTSGNVGYTAGFNRHASWGIANTGNTAVSAVGAFVYRDTHRDWYVVKVTSLKHSGDKAWFAGRVTSASQSGWVGNWLFAEVNDNAPDQIWGSFTTQAAAESGVNSMSNPLDGPFNVTSGNLTVH